jgi:[CysO sulfur-carrier protein]-S-L-cysteine hydrolase
MKPMLELHLSQQHLADILSFAVIALPEEVCGLLAGAEGYVEQVYPIQNVSPMPQLAFEMDGQAQVNALLDIEDRRWSLLAIYHSHPPGSRTDPSPVDIADASYPGALHVIIVPTADGAVASLRAFQIEEGQVIEVPIIVD